jgi:hypothetical protein
MCNVLLLWRKYGIIICIKVQSSCFTEQFQSGNVLLPWHPVVSKFRSSSFRIYTRLTIACRTSYVNSDMSYNSKYSWKKWSTDRTLLGCAKFDYHVDCSAYHRTFFEFAPPLLTGRNFFCSFYLLQLCWGAKYSAEARSKHIRLEILDQYIINFTLR